MSTDMQTNGPKLDRASAAFALAAAITVIFNTALAWIKDAYDPLNEFMKSLTGHHWTTHGLVDIVLFFALGLIFMNTGGASRINPNRLVVILVGASVVAALGLAAWFVLF